MSFLDALIGGAADIAGGLINQSTTERMNQRNFEQALFMAQNSIQMKVADANKAGINPLAALGVTSVNPPVNVGDTSLGAGVSAAGSKLAGALSDSDTEDRKLNRELLRVKIQAAKQDLVANQIKNSRDATTLGTPGPERSVPWNWQIGGPSDPRPEKGRTPFLTGYYIRNPDGSVDRFNRMTPEAAQATQSAANLPLAPADAARIAASGLSSSAPMRPDTHREFLKYWWGRAKESGPIGPPM